MKLTNMQLSKQDAKETCMPCSPDNAPRYPYGLTLRLDESALKKLGATNLPKVGAKMTIHALGVVTSVSSHESKERENRNVEIQIQDLGLSPAEPLSSAEKRDAQRNDFNAAFAAQKQARKG